jgi:hypothetical protein
VDKEKSIERGGWREMNEDIWMERDGWREKIWMKRNTSREFERGGLKEIDEERWMEKS